MHEPAGAVNVGSGRPAPFPGPAGLDVLSDALRVVRASGALLLRGEFTAPWVLAAPDSSVIAKLVEPDGARLVILHVVAEGRCWIDAPGCERVVLEPGEIVLFPRGTSHLLGWEAAAPVPIAELLPAPPWVDLPVVSHGGGGARTRIVCCYLRCDHLLFNPFLDALPPVLHLRAHDAVGADWFRASVQYLITEASRGGPGCGALVSRLAELLFVESLRAQLSKHGETGWLAGLADPFVARALHALHADPAQGWTVAHLARTAGLSRSALMARFQRLLRQSPMQYLTLWRMQLAAQRLRGTEETLSAIAGAVGYGSEAAFSHAFKRATGVSPATWRRARRASPQNDPTAPARRPWAAFLAEPSRAAPRPG
jgi:AraC-like DNA-binding protein